LAEFCLVNDIKPDEMIKTIYNEEEQRLPSWEKSINKWFEAYDEHCKEQQHTKKTRDNRRTIVNAFIGFHELSTYSEKGKRRKTNGFKEPNIRKALTKKEIRKMLNSCRTWKMKSLILIQTSSGLSISDILKLKVKDFQNGITIVSDVKSRKKRRICKFHLIREKTKKKNL